MRERLLGQQNTFKRFAFLVMESAGTQVLISSDSFQDANGAQKCKIKICDLEVATNNFASLSVSVATVSWQSI